MMKPFQSHSWESEIQIKRSSNQPLYLQVKEGLEHWILSKLHDGSLSDGDRLPSENELSEALGISNITIKRSLDELRRQGLILRIQGRGTFVTGQERLTFDLPRMFSLTSYTAESGKLPARKILEMSEHVASPNTAKILGLTARARVVRLVRLRLVDHTPVAVDISYLPQKLMPDLVRVYRDGLSLYEVMAQRYGLAVVKAHDRLEPSLIKTPEARALEVLPGALGMKIERIGYDASDRPLEYTIMMFRGDICAFSIDNTKESHGRQPPAK